MESNLTSEDKHKLGIYLLRNKDTNEVYVGSGKLSERLKAHQKNLIKQTHVNYKLQNSFNNNPNMEFIGSPIDIDGITVKENRMLALSLEQVFIDKLNGNPLFLNIAMKVDKPTLGVKLSEERKLEIGRKSKEVWKNLSPDIIKQHSEKISKAQNKYWASLSTEEKFSRTEIIRNVSIGKELSNDRKLEIGDFFRGKPLSNEHKEKISKALKDKPKDPISVSNAVNARKLNGSYKSNESQILACSHSVVIEGEKFPSITAAATAKKVSRPTITNRLKDEKFADWILVSNQPQPQHF